MQLSKNERVVRQWDYATSQSGAMDLNKTRATLTVTNKRIVHDVRNKLEISRTEVQLKDVKTVHLTQTKKSMAGPVMMIILGLVFIAVGAAMLAGLVPMEGQAAIIGAIPLFLGVLIAFKGFLSLRGGAFTLNLYTYDSSEESMTIGARGGSGLGKKNNSKIKVIVNNDVASEIVDSLTAIILDAKDHVA